MSMHPAKNYFKEFSNKIFVETGSYRGDAIQLALDAGFEKIISIDIDQKNINFCYKRFTEEQHEHITLICGDSAYCLYDAIKDIDERITFWLDSHWQMLEGEVPGKNPFPLLDELKQIAQHKIKTHTILIDDMLIFQDDITLYNKYIIQHMLRVINDDYKFEYRSNPVINNILIAYIMNEEKKEPAQPAPEPQTPAENIIADKKVEEKKSDDSKFEDRTKLIKK